MKKIIVVALILGVFSSLIYTSNSMENRKIHLKLSYTASTVDQLVEDSQVIIDCISSEKSEVIVYNEVEFIVTEMKIKDVIKGENLKKGDTITILQTNSYEDPTVQKDKEKILFIEKYEGPIVEDAYVCVGLYQGQFDLEDDKMIPVYNIENGLGEISLTKVKDKVDKIRK